MLKTKISNITNSPVTLAIFKEYVGGINHTLQDVTIQRHLDNALIWASEMSNIPAGDFDVQLSQNKPTTKQELLFDNITITTVKDLITGDEIEYTTNVLFDVVETDSEYQYLINYSCTAVDDAVLTNAILNYAVFLYSGQTDMDAKNRIIKDLQIIQNEIY